MKAELYQQLRQMSLAIGQGKIAATVNPATANVPATTGTWSRTVSIRLVNSDDESEQYTWIDRQLFAGLVSVSDTSTLGTATISSTDLYFEDGVARIVVTGDAAAWVAGETVTVTVANLTYNGTTVTGGSAVYTVV